MGHELSAGGSSLGFVGGFIGPLLAPKGDFLGDAAHVIGGLTAATDVASLLLSVNEAKRARNFQKDIAQRKFQYMRQDLEAAGFNPMLAFGQGGGGGHPGTGGAGAIQADVSAIRGTPARSVAAAKSVRLLGAEVKIKEEEAKQMKLGTEISHYRRDAESYAPNRAQAALLLENNMVDIAQQDVHSAKFRATTAVADPQHRLNQLNIQEQQMINLALDAREKRAKLQTDEQRAAFDKSRAGKILIGVERSLQRTIGNVPTGILFGAGRRKGSRPKRRQ